MRRFLLSLLILLFVVGVYNVDGQERKADAFLRNGDLLFQDLDCGPMCDAIEEVTQGIKGAKFSHVGIVWQKSDSLFVIEAISKGVVVTALNDFLGRSQDSQGKPKVVVGRLKNKYRNLINPAIKEALKFLGKPYDDYFQIDNDAYYCSELVYFAFLQANGNKPLFPLSPMTYKSPRTGDYYPVWKEYFQKLGVSIPEGKPGINPGGISRSPMLDIYFSFGKPDGVK
ncbi:MAG: YiiX/YebB-like N1pC/P60 family cysteine hydrolase [Bacteroidota bacterium]|nr:YiiX/YebB-like N1pC/P60 family cysteine hydrolase [Bacteroidota bacterium]